MSTKSKKTMKDYQLEEGRRQRQKYLDELGISLDDSSSSSSSSNNSSSSGSSLSSSYSNTSTTSTKSKKTMKDYQLEEGRRQRQKYLDGYRNIPNETMAPSEY